VETNEISLHQFKIYDALKKSQEWLSMKDIVKQTGAARGTVGQHLRRFIKLGLVDQAEVWPGHRFRLSPHAEKRNKSLMERLEQSGKIFSQFEIGKLSKKP